MKKQSLARQIEAFARFTRTWCGSAICPVQRKERTDAKENTAGSTEQYPLNAIKVHGGNEGVTMNGHDWRRTGKSVVIAAAVAAAETLAHELITQRTV